MNDDRDGKYLLVEERTSSGIVLNQPAGHLEDDESLVEAVIRETLEETAWHFFPSAITGIYRWRHPVNHTTFLRVCFTGECKDHEPARALDDEILQTVWMSEHELMLQIEKIFHLTFHLGYPA